MVTGPTSGMKPDDLEEYYDELVERWPAQRPSRRAKRASRRTADRQIVVRAERRDAPDGAHVSRALLAAQRELARLQAENEARAAADAPSSPNGREEP